MLPRLVSRTQTRRWYAHQHVYQKTLTLPKTKFPNRSNLQKTVDFLIPQSSQNVYKIQLNEFLAKLSMIEGDRRKLNFVKENLFVLHDGPPYANGDLHFGHALNKILKDIINRYQLSRGKYVFYKPGWDCHGLPIEIKALKDINIERLDSISPAKIRSMASSHATKTIKAQKKQFEHFAIMTDWEDPYITMDPKYEINQLRIFQKMLSRGLIKRQNKPVFWGTETRTALAEGELEYNEKHESIAAYVKFPLTSESNLNLLEKLPKDIMVEYFVEKEGNDSINCLIWTSTPWTIFSNRAICFNENFTYSLIQLEHDCIIVESDLLDQLHLPKPYKVLAQFPGLMLRGLQYTNPLLRDGVPRPLLHADHVISSTGTGLVHTAPGNGPDDYLVGVQHDLEIFSPVDPTGRYKLEELPQHLHDILTETETDLPRKVLDTSTATAIVTSLQDFNMLYKSHQYTHSYPYDWRSKKPIIIRATPQWFTDLHDVKELALQGIENVQFYPERGKTRLRSFIKGRNEWCISRQRSWGVPIPAFYRKDNLDVPLMTEETVEHAITVIEKKGINAWFSPSNGDKDMEEWLPERFKEQAHDYFRGKDTMDVWFDSGSSWNVIEDFYRNTLQLRELPSPLSDLYLEGSDQHRGWFQSSFLTRVAYSGAPTAPYKTLITHGFTLDENGIKMSKSIGNTISPKAIMEGDERLALPALGVDGLRYLVAQSNFTTDVVAGPIVMKHVVDALKKYRLTFRFLLGNLPTSGFSLISLDKLRPVDMYAISRLQEIMNLSEKYYKEYNFSKVLTTLQYHMTNDLSSFYFDISKDCLYCDSKSSTKRQQIQTTLFHILDTYRAILMPILPVLVQEVWNYLPKQIIIDEAEHHSPASRLWPSYDVPEGAREAFESNELAILQKFRDQFKKLSNEVTKSTQTITNIYTDASNLPFTAEQIADILQTAKVNILPSSLENTTNDNSTVVFADGTKLKIQVEASRLSRCPRCWKNNAPEENRLCPRCDEVNNKAK